MKTFNLPELSKLWKKLYGEDFRKNYSGLYKTLKKKELSLSTAVLRKEDSMTIAIITYSDKKELRVKVRQALIDYENAKEALLPKVWEGIGYAPVSIVEKDGGSYMLSIDLEEIPHY